MYYLCVFFIENHILALFVYFARDLSEGRKTWITFQKQNQKFYFLIKNVNNTIRWPLSDPSFSYGNMNFSEVCLQKRVFHVLENSQVPFVRFNFWK